MKKYFLVLFFHLLCFVNLCGQNNKWTLDRCIEYALENNITIKEMELNHREKELNLNTAKHNRLPDMNATLGQNIYFGRGPSRDGTYKDNTQLTSVFNVSSDIIVFAGMSIKHDIAGRKYDLLAAIEDVKRTREDVSLNITGLFLQVLLCSELKKIAKDQVSLSLDLVVHNQQLLQGGRSIESDLVESQAVLANDELNLTQAENDYSLALLDLCQAINYKNPKHFEIDNSYISSTQIDTMFFVNGPEKIYEYAIHQRPHIKAEEIRLKSSKQNLLSAKAARYPQITLSGGYSNSYYYSYISGYNNANFINQLRNNGNEYIGLNISIPIFNRLATKNQILKAKISYQYQELIVEKAAQALKKEIEQSYYNAQNAYKKYLSAVRSVEASNKVFQFQQKKLQAGRTTFYDYKDAKNRLEKALSEMVQAKYIYIFRCKILDFYTK